MKTKSGGGFQGRGRMGERECVRWEFYVKMGPKSSYFLVLLVDGAKLHCIKILQRKKGNYKEIWSHTLQLHILVLKVNGKAIEQIL